MIQFQEKTRTEPTGQRYLNPQQLSLQTKWLWVRVSLQSLKKISSIHLFILKINPILESVTRLVTIIFDYVHPKMFWSTVDLHELVSTCKKSGHFINLFWRHGSLENPAILLFDNILAHISRKEFFAKYGIWPETVNNNKSSLQSKFHED